MRAMRIRRHAKSPTYCVKMDKRGHALLYYGEKLLMVLNAKDTASLKLRIQEKSNQEAQVILDQYIQAYSPEPV